MVRVIRKLNEVGMSELGEYMPEVAPGGEVAEQSDILYGIPVDRVDTPEGVIAYEISEADLFEPLSLPYENGDYNPSLAVRLVDDRNKRLGSTDAERRSGQPRAPGLFFEVVTKPDEPARYRILMFPPDHELPEMAGRTTGFAGLVEVHCRVDSELYDLYKIAADDY